MSPTRLLLMALAVASWIHAPSVAKEPPRQQAQPAERPGPSTTTDPSEPLSQQVPGAAAALGNEYAQQRRAFYADPAAGPAPIAVSWTGELDWRTAEQHPAPPSGVITDQAAFDKLRSDWQLSGRSPRIDFQNYLVLAAIGGDSGAHYEVLSKLTDQGDFRYQFVAAELVKTGGPVFFVWVVPRERIRSVQGIAVPRAVQNRARPAGASH